MSAPPAHPRGTNGSVDQWRRSTWRSQTWADVERLKAECRRARRRRRARRLAAVLLLGGIVVLAYIIVTGAIG